MTTHVEFLPNVVTFCGLRAADVPPGDAVILARDWAHAIERIQLGDSARIRIAALGMKVDVHDIDESALAEN